MRWTLQVKKLQVLLCVHYHPVTVAQKYKEYKASKQRDESIEPLVETTNITKRGKRRRRRNRKKNRKLNRKTFKTLKKQFKMERIVLNNSNPDRVISNIRSSIQTTMDQK
eukprot:589280_1